MSQAKDTRDPRGWVFYDGECRFCTGWAQRFASSLQTRGYALTPLQTAWVKERLKLPSEKLLEEMRVITPDGQILGGIDAVLYLSRAIWWTWPLYALSLIPGAKPCLQGLYRIVAKRRQCLRLL